RSLSRCPPSDSPTGTRDAARRFKSKRPLNLCASRGVPVRREQTGEEDAMLITLPRAVAPGPVGATLLTIDGRLAAALVVAVAAIAAGICAEALHGRRPRRGGRRDRGRDMRRGAARLDAPSPDPRSRGAHAVTADPTGRLMASRT